MTQNIGFIGGGRMAEALISGILKASLYKAKAVQAAEPLASRGKYLQDTYKIATTDAAKNLVETCSVLVLAVKPQIVPAVLEEIKTLVTKDHLIISIAAGVRLAKMEKILAGTGCRLIRVMPNTPALVLQGASAISPAANASKSDCELAGRIFDAVGRSVVLPENYLDAVTGLSGSGPAYVFTFLEGLIDAGVRVGLSRPDAELLSLQTVLGSVLLALDTGKSPAELKAMVTSPGGTTIAGLHEFARAGFQGIIMDAVYAATKRSEELGGDD